MTSKERKAAHKWAQDRYGPLMVDPDAAVVVAFAAGAAWQRQQSKAAMHQFKRIIKLREEIYRRRYGAPKKRKVATMREPEQLTAKERRQLRGKR